MLYKQAIDTLVGWIKLPKIVTKSRKISGSTSSTWNIITANCTCNSSCLRISENLLVYFRPPKFVLMVLIVVPTSTTTVATADRNNPHTSAFEHFMQLKG